MARQIWKNSASILLIAERNTTALKVKSFDRNKLPGKLKHDQYDYRILLLKRGKEDKFMPSTYVFPGGVLDNADLSNEWVPIFSKLDDKFLTRFILPDDKPRPFKFADPIINGAGSPKASEATLPFEIATRICAIRETFEESGLLLARKSIQGKTPNNGETFPFDDKRNLTWQKKISTNANHFISLCKENKICPDIWALNEWANWLTPTVFSRRFNAVFYTCFLKSVPAVVVQKAEVEHSQWFSPTEVFDHFYAGQLVLPAPQNYEIRRIGQIESIEKLKNFCKTRALQGTECYLPVIATAANGKLNILKGDELYPAEPDFFGLKPRISYDKTIEELKTNAKYLNRGENKSDNIYDYKFYCNIKLPCEQLSPTID